MHYTAVQSLHLSKLFWKSCELIKSVWKLRIIQTDESFHQTFFFFLRESQTEAAFPWHFVVSFPKFTFALFAVCDGLSFKSIQFPLLSNHSAGPLFEVNGSRDPVRYDQQGLCETLATFLYIDTCEYNSSSDIVVICRSEMKIQLQRQFSFQRSPSPPSIRRSPPPSSSCGGCFSWGRPSSAPPLVPPLHCRCCCCQGWRRSEQFWTKKKVKYIHLVSSVSYCATVCFPGVASHSLSSSWSISGSISSSALLGSTPTQKE